MSSTETDAEDVNDFLKRIQELGTKRDQEDEERNRKLEEEILQGRKERQARRAERARSISPTKDSPAHTPPPHRPSTAERARLTSTAALSAAPDLQPTTPSSTRSKDIDTSMDRLAGERPPMKENSLPYTETGRGHAERGLQRTTSIKASPSSVIPPSQNSPLAWQRRPNSEAPDRPRSRPLSMIATENAARSPRGTPEPSSASDEQTPVSRDQISQMLGSKDPAWFRQTADRGEGSPAYRKNQVEDNSVVEAVSSSRVHLPGMSKEPTRQAEQAGHNLVDLDRSISPSRNSSSNGSTGRSPFRGAPLGSSSIGSPLPLTSAQRLDPLISHIDDDAFGSDRGLAMSPSQGRISPERGDRPASPTKGMGGFVQSAMMKRSDSVSKRWSVQSPPGLSRGNSIASNRSSLDPNANLSLGGREPRPSLSRDDSPLPLSRPASSHSNSTVVQDGDRPGTSSSLRSSMITSTTNDGFVKPSMPATRPQVSLASRDGELDSVKESRIETTPPTSPSKVMDTRRWSPTKSSWLESALNKPDLPKPKTVLPPQQPSWMSEINKAKQRGTVDPTPSPPVHKHEVNIGGLLRSPPLGGFAKPLSIGGLPTGFSSTPSINSSKSNTLETITNVKTPASSSEALQRVTGDSPDGLKSAALSTPAGSVSKGTSLSPSSGKVKPETPPKKDFRANLKSRQLPSENNGNEEPEFKNVFGQLRRTKTQNYVAPDELKDNILRGKAGLNVTGGPKKTERKDEFKEAILKKKEDFRKAQLEGTGVRRATSGSSQGAPPLPEALAKKAALGRSATVASREQGSSKDPVASPSETSSRQRASMDPPTSSLHKEISAPGRMQGMESSGGKLADRFNPTLASLLARGPPSTASDTPRTSSPVSSLRNVSTSTMTTDGDSQNSGPQLMHMTKARARGPRRKAPPALIASNQPSEATVIIKQDSALASPLKDSPQRATVSLNEAPKSATTPPSTQDQLENTSSQPTSPRKLDLKRRSRFLEEVPNKNEKTLHQLDAPNPLSPVKKANVVELPVGKQALESTMPDSKVAPSPKPKPSSLSTSPKLESRAVITKSTEIPLENAELPTAISQSKSRNVAQLNLPGALEERSQQSESAVDADSVISVRNGAALFNRQTIDQKSPQASTGVKAPIKLPTRDDENAAMIGAGLRSPYSDSASDTKLVGLGLQGLQMSPATDDRKADYTVVTPPLKINGAAATVRSSARPLPSLPLTPAMSPSASAGFKPASPRKITNQPVPQSSEASKLLLEFFGRNEFVQSFHVDTAAILAARPNHPAKIKTLRSQLFQISGDGKQQVPNHQERILFENNMYLCSHTFGTQAGKKVIEVYFWAGDGVPESSIEDAELFAQREARAAGGKLVKIRQGKETSEFIEALGGIMITRRGSCNKYDSLAPHILCGRRYAGQIVFDEVDFSPSSLCSGFPYLISTQSGKSYLWKGRGSGIDEISCARLTGTDFGLTGEIEEVEDGNEPASFLKIFGNTKIAKSADHWRLKPNYQKYCARLFCADATSKSQIIEMTPFTQSSLSHSQIYILDAFFEIYIIVGSASQSQYSAFCTALLFAQEYGILAASMEDRPFVPVSTVVLEGVPRDLKFVFRKWKEGAGPTIMHPPMTPLSRGRSLRVVPLSAALDATRF